MRIGLALLLLAGCDQVWGLEGRVEIDAIDPDSRICEIGTAFGPGTAVEIDGAYSVEAARFDPAQSIAYLSLCTPGDRTKMSCELYQSAFVRATGKLSFYSRLSVGAPMKYDSYAAITPNAQYLVFGSDRLGPVRVFVSVANAGQFTVATELSVIASVSYANEPYLLGDGQTLYLEAGMMNSSTGADIYRARGGPPTFGGASDLVDGVSSPQGEYAPVVSDDELEIFFASDRESTMMPPDFPLDIFRATRDAKGAAFKTPVKLDSLSTTNGIDWPVWLSPNRCDLYYINKVSDFATLLVAHR